MMHPVVVLIDLRAHPHHVGLLPTFLDANDPRPAAEQFQERYLYGGWRPQEGFTKGRKRYELLFPGDPPLNPIAAMMLGEETIMVYQHGYVAIWQPDGSFEMCRMD
jgi:hypothetical protein